jgi:hypothetical protein
MATGTSHFTGYLPLSRHFISAFNNGFHLVFSDMYSKQSITSATVGVLNNLRVKWYIWSPNRRSLCIYPGLWLALYIEATITFFFFLFFWYQFYYFWYFFFHNTCLTSNKAKFCTMVVASTGFSKSLVTSVIYAMSCTSMNELKNAMMSAHGRSFFLYSNCIVSLTRTMCVHKVHVSP